MLRKLYEWLFPEEVKIIAVKKVLSPEKVITRDKHLGAVVVQDEIIMWNAVKKKTGRRVFKFWRSK